MHRASNLNLASVELYLQSCLQKSSANRNRNVWNHNFLPNSDLSINVHPDSRSIDAALHLRVASHCGIATPATEFIEHLAGLLIPLLQLYCRDEDVFALRGLRGED